MRVRRSFWPPFCFCASGMHPSSTVSPATVAPTLQGDAAHPGQAKGWVDTRLYFGLDSEMHRVFLRTG